VVHNINGLKGNRHKIEPIIERIENKSLDIIGIVETNITSKEGHYIVNQESSLSSFWTSAEEGKNKGSGIGAIVSNEWAKHIGQVKRYSGYLLELHFFFKQLELVVFIVYMAPNNQQRRKEVQRVIMKEIA
jgi:exonuclease III